jgi:hypothetical protein
VPETRVCYSLAFDGDASPFGETAYQVAQAYAFREENDRAFSWLERAYAQHDGALVGIKHDPLLKNVHRDPRWPVLLNQMHLPN